MIWTKEKPTIPGYYWLKMTDTPFTQQPPRVVKVGKVDDGHGWDGTELMALEAPDYEDGLWLTEMEDTFDWSSEPLFLPEACDVEEICGKCAYHSNHESGRILCTFNHEGRGKGRKITARKERTLGDCGLQAKNFKKKECGCRQLGSAAACSSCDSTIPLPVES